MSQSVKIKPMYSIKWFIIIICLVHIDGVIAQSQNFDDENILYTQIVSINKDMGTIESSVKSSFRTYWSNSALNEKGNMIVSSGKLIKSIDGIAKTIVLPVSGSCAALPRFNSDNNLLTYWEYVDTAINPNEYTVYLFDSIFEKIIDTYTFSTFPYRSTEKVSSNDASTIIFKNGTYLHIYYKKENKYLTTVLEEHKTYFDCMVSSDGNRIFYFYNDGENHYPFVYRDKSSDGWTKEFRIPNIDPLFTMDISKSLFRPEAVSIDGKKLLVSNHANSFYFIQENNTEWSEPQFIGTYDKPNTLFDFSIYCSDDLRVIAIKQPALLFPDKEEYIVYDLLIYIQNRDGQWSKYQINPKGNPIIDSILLSPDGDELYWIPSAEYSSSNFAIYQQ